MYKGTPGDSDYLQEICYFTNLFFHYQIFPYLEKLVIFYYFFEIITNSDIQEHGFAFKYTFVPM